MTFSKSVPNERRRCPSEQNTSGSTLFVIAAHVSNRANCALLTDTIRSITCFHPKDPILIVDNNSPNENARNAILAAGNPALHMLRIRRSRGQLGAWRAADAHLRARLTSTSKIASHEDRRLPSLNRIARVVVLQHSTRLTGRVDLIEGCEAVALAGVVGRDANNSWMDPHDRGTKWASEVAASLHISCLPPCTHSHTIRSGKADSPLDWAAAVHSVAIFSRAAWDAMSAMRLWEHDGRHAVKPTQELWHSKTDSEGERKVRIFNNGLEKLTGILLAKLNRNPQPADKCSVPAYRRPLCRYHEGGARACNTTRHHFTGVVKIHGGTFVEGAPVEICSAPQATSKSAPPHS
mmetsp:Transcript_34647/g.57323  ORF Transcript_34647/g.57323 Transcript_34647/m.57323 type:complete len:350 (+) Transcript_34647:57-1106(+)